jgi:hypothetical protein
MYFDRNERSLAVQHPIVFPFQNAQGILLKTKGFPQQPLRPIAVQSPDCCLSRNCYSQPVIGLIVWQDKGGNQRAVVASTVLVYLFELSATTQVDFHSRLVMSRSEPFSPLGTASLQHQPTVLGCHSRAKSVRLCSAPVIGLEGPFGHMITILPSSETIRLNASLSGVKKPRALARLTLENSREEERQVLPACHSIRLVITQLRLMVIKRKRESAISRFVQGLV